MERIIIDINKAEKEHLPLVGGKGANLGDIARGLQVPPGFILTSLAYKNQMQLTGMQKKIQIILDKYDTTSNDEAESASKEITALFENLKILPEVEEKIIKAYSELAAGKNEFKVAVRSSATAEDLSDASFAGLQETFLNISGIEDVLHAVSKCWASLWTSRAIYYRSRRGFQHDEVRMAVIIQEMVPAEISGVMFTANPVNNSRNEIMIEVVSGLGEALVSGEVTGDSYIVAKNDVSCDIISKKIQNPTGAYLLNDFDIKQLALSGIKIERFYGDYQDVEWAYYKGQFYFLQTRPITTLGDEILPDIDFTKLNYMQREVMKWMEERFPNPVHPIDGIVVKVILMAFFEAMENHGYKVDYFDWERIDQGIFPEFFETPVIKPGWKRALSYLQLFAISRRNPAKEWAEEKDYLLEMLDRLQKRNVATLPFELIQEFITEAFNHLHFFIVLRYHYFMLNGIPSTVFSKILKWGFGEKAQQIMENLVAGIPCITMEINEKIEKLAFEAKEYPAVTETILNFDLSKISEKLESVSGGPEFLEKFNKFLAEYGERETDMGLGGIASPTWQDAPEVLWGIIKGILLDTVQIRNKEKTAVCDRVKEAEEKVYKRFSKGIYRLLGIRKLIPRLVEHNRNFAIFRENSHYHLTKGLHVFRILFLELGERYVRRGFLKDPRDVFYLTYFDIKDINNIIFHGLEDVDTKALYKKINQRKDEQERRYERWRVKHLVEGKDENKLQGVASSSGIISGIARIIKDPKDFGRLSPGDILVAPYTNPAWTPLFSVIGGLVVDSGGAASHASIIAREYGIPAVMGTANATQTIRDGEKITVDGTKGIVYRD